MIHTNDRQVTNIEGEAYADSIGAHFIELSAKTGEGVDKLIYFFEEEIHKLSSFKTIIIKNIKLKKGDYNKNKCIM